MDTGNSSLVVSQLKAAVYKVPDLKALESKKLEKQIFCFTSILWKFISGTD